MREGHGFCRNREEELESDQAGAVALRLGKGRVR